VTALQELGFDAPPASWQEFHDMACAFTEQGWSATKAMMLSVHHSHRCILYRGGHLCVGW